MRLITLIKKICNDHDIRTAYDRIYNDKSANKDGYLVRFAIETKRIATLPDIKAFIADFTAAFPYATKVCHDDRILIYIQLPFPVIARPSTKISRNFVVINVDGSWEHCVSLATNTETNKLYCIAAISELQKLHYRKYKNNHYRKKYQLSEKDKA